MKIGLIIYGSLDTISGGYLYDRMLVRALRAAGHELRIFSLPWRRYPLHLADNLRLSLLREIATAGLDLLLQDELNHPSLFLLNRYLSPRQACPIVAIVHHLRSQEEHPRLLRRFYAHVERSYLASVDAFLYNSETTRRTVEQLLGFRPPGHVAHPAADHIAPPDHSSVVSALGKRARADRPLDVLFVGNVAPRKGLHLLIDALAGLPFASWRLTIVGASAVDPAYTTAIHRQIARLGLGPNITWLGSVPESRLRQAYATNDLLVVPSFEGFGIVYLEAMAHGCPAIASTAGAAHEVVNHEVNGYLTRPGDTAQLTDLLYRLACSRTQLAVLGYNARYRFEQHPTWQSSMAGAASWLHEIKHWTGQPHADSHRL